jgi:hypothetical protein
MEQRWHTYDKKCVAWGVAEKAGEREGILKRDLNNQFSQKKSPLDRVIASQKNGERRFVHSLAISIDDILETRNQAFCFC